MSKPASSQGKQSSLLGFFTKSAVQKPAPAAAPATNTPRQLPPATPSTATSAGSSSYASGSSSNVKPAVKVSLKSNHAPSNTVKTSEMTIDLSSDGIEEDSISFSKLRDLNSFRNDTQPFGAAGNKSTLGGKAQAALLPRSIPTPPLTSDGEDIASAGDRSNSLRNSATPGASTSASDIGADSDMLYNDDEDDEEHISKRPASKRAQKRRAIVDSEGEEDEDEELQERPLKKAVKGKMQPPNGKKQKIKDDEYQDEDEAMLSDDDGGVDWDAVINLSDGEGSKPIKKAVTKKKAEKAAPKNKPKATGGLLQTSADAAREERQTAYREEGEVFDFLKDEHIRDRYMKRPDDPMYDPRTVYIPPKQEEKFTPFERQFWDIKRNHMDTVLFFQKGKFFELYERDADIGHQEFDLKLTGRVKMRMVGVPEASIDFWIAKFLGAGHKVGRVEQAETAIGADMRRKEEKKGKAAAAVGKGIVQRTLKSVLTTGTVTDGHILTDDLSNHCICIKEYIADAAGNPRFGIVVADCSTAQFSISAFEDDACRTRLETTIRQHKPKELVCERGNLSVPTMRLLRACVGPDCSWTMLKAGSEFPDSEHAIADIEKIFDDKVPAEVQGMYGNPEAMSAMGGVLFYLRSLNLDRDLFAVRNFNIFDPIRNGQALVVDGQTLAHVEVLQNSEGTDEGTVFKLLCRCETSFGKRLLKIWVSQPLREAAAINARLDAVGDIMESQTFRDTWRKVNKGMPDLERLISRIHAGSCRVRDFTKVLSVYERLDRAFADLTIAAEDFQSAGIKALLRSAPDVAQLVEHVQSFFTVSENGEEVIPIDGADEEYDATTSEVAAIEKALDDELQKCKRLLGTKDIAFKDIGTKDIYQIEVPVKVKVPSNWTKMTGTKDKSRYWNREVEKLVGELKEARELKDQAGQVFRFKVYAEFSENYADWLQAVKTLAEIDCLVSLALASDNLGHPACRPEIIDSPRAFVDFEGLRHPCVFSTTSDFIPNDVKLGGDAAKMILLTGPNMAGKSTLLRMSCVGLIMAQIGCYVPATSARISPCDRIVSRMGASDNMLAGQSTFRVEMEDCRKILIESTPRTMVILDELGRGTSTFDGLSIAFAVLHQLAGHTGCIGFFATHFTSLVDDFAQHPQIALKHMSTHVDDTTREVTFVYHLTDGCSPKSYGPHVASMAGVPRDVVERAIAISQKFEERTKLREQTKKKDQALTLDLQADAAFLLKTAATQDVAYDEHMLELLHIIRQKIASRQRMLTI